MIIITRLNNTQIIINCEHIESIEETPDTTITMIKNKKFIAKESPEEIIRKTIEYKQGLYSGETSKLR